MKRIKQQQDADEAKLTAAKEANRQKVTQPVGFKNMTKDSKREIPDYLNEEKQLQQMKDSMKQQLLKSQHSLQRNQSQTTEIKQSTT